MKWSSFWLFRKFDTAGEFNFASTSPASPSQINQAAAESAEQSLAANERQILEQQQHSMAETIRMIQTSKQVVLMQRMERSGLIAVKELETAMETASEYQAFPATACNTTIIDLYAAVEVEEKAFWQKDREERKARIALENAARRSALTLEERAAEDQSMIEEAEEQETKEAGMSADIILNF